MHPSLPMLTFSPLVIPMIIYKYMYISLAVLLDLRDKNK